MNYDLIDKNFTSVSILEEMPQVGQWLLEKPYYVIVDEEFRNVGIVTAIDYIRNPNTQLINCCFTKPLINVHHKEDEVFEIMKETGNHYLPVFEGDELIGVVSVFSVIGVPEK